MTNGNPIDIKVSPLQENTVILIYLDRNAIFLDPEYQRTSDIWSIEKRQLLIDSIINGFDIPKFYFHEYAQPRTHDGSVLRYALIDGKQRLSAIWEFIGNEFPLSEDMQFLRDPTLKLAGLTYTELGKQFPKIAAYFEGRPLSIMTVRTSDTELIEEMFSRLNEAVPLNAPERRNALGGPLPAIIRSLVNTKFFTHNLPFSNRRYRHFDLACKFLYLINAQGFDDTKKLRLDHFVKDFKQHRRIAKAKELETETLRVLRSMTNVFIKSDPLLRNVGMIVVFFMLFRQAIYIGRTNQLERAGLVKFEKLRERNRKIAEADIEKAKYDLIKFEELATSVNDSSALKYRYDTLCKYAFPDLGSADMKMATITRYKRTK